MSDDLEPRSHHAITHDGETFIKLADASVTFSLYRKDIAAQAAEIARLRARVVELEGALRKINDKDSYSGGSYGPFAEIARAALEGKKDE